jgi:hypothetical protein
LSITRIIFIVLLAVVLWVIAQRLSHAHEAPMSAVPHLAQNQSCKNDIC